MILSDVEIRKAIKEGLIIIEPEPKSEQFSTSAVDLTLGEQIFEPKAPNELDEEPTGIEIIVDTLKIDIQTLIRRYSKPLQADRDGSFILHPSQFVLSTTNERIELPNDIAARVEGRSTLARLGLLVHFTAPTIQAGFRGRIVLEMCNFGKYPLRLHPKKLAICQLIFERLGEPASMGEPPTDFMNQKGVYE